MPDQIRLIPLDAIDAEAMPRDRTAADPAAFDELVASIARRRETWAFLVKSFKQAMSPVSVSLLCLASPSE